MMNCYMKAIILFCLFSLATTTPPSQEDTVIDMLHQYCTSQMSPALTGETRRPALQPKVGKTGPGILNYTAIEEKISAKYLDLEAKFNESFARLERIVVARLETGDTEIEETRTETAENLKRTKENQKNLENRIDEKIKQSNRAANRKLKRCNVKIEETRNEAEKVITENRKNLEAKFNESFARLERIVVARLERGDTEIEETRNETAENLKRTKENQKNLETRIDERFESLKRIVVARLDRSDTEIDKIQNDTTKNSKTIEEARTDLESRIQENVERIVNRVLDKSSAKMEEIRNETRKVIEEYRRDQREMTSRSTSGSSKTTESPHQATTSTKTRTESTTTSIGDPCTNGMIYENKCFITVRDLRSSYYSGIAICGDRGGQLANIYSQTHMYDIMKYIRENRLSDYGSSYQYFRLGMKYDPKADKFTLRDGTDAPAGLKWFPGYPFTVEANGEGYAGYTSVLLYVTSDQSSTNQYLFNSRPSYKPHGLCETE